jgi:hypothetical protein
LLTTGQHRINSKTITTKWELDLDLRMEQVPALSMYYFAQSMHIFVAEITDCRQQDSFNGLIHII